MNVSESQRITVRSSGTLLSPVMDLIPDNCEDAGGMISLQHNGFEIYFHNFIPREVEDTL